PLDKLNERNIAQATAVAEHVDELEIGVALVEAGRRHLGYDPRVARAPLPPDPDGDAALPPTANQRLEELRHRSVVVSYRTPDMPDHLDEHAQVRYLGQLNPGRRFMVAVSGPRRAEDWIVWEPADDEAPAETGDRPTGTEPSGTGTEAVPEQQIQGQPPSEPDQGGALPAPSAE